MATKESHEKEALEEALRRLDDVEDPDKDALEEALKHLQEAEEHLKKSIARRESTEENLDIARRAVRRLA